MKSHFLSLIERLTIEDIEVLNTLNNQESSSRFSAKTKKEIQEITEISESKFRKTLCRLEAMNFIEIVPGNREHLLFVTDYGQNAIQNIFERSNA